MANLDFKLDGEREVICETPVFNVIKQKKISPKGEEFNAISVAAPNWVSAIIYLTDCDKYVLVNQFRHGINKAIVEFPCGQVEEDETSLEAVLRECNKEVGLNQKYIKSITKLWEANPNPAFMENRMTCYFIKAKTLTGRQNLDSNEYLDICYFSKEEVSKIMENPETSAMMKLAWAYGCEYDE